MREVALRLVLKGLERARDAVTAVADRTERTLERTKSLSAELRGAAERAEKLRAGEQHGGAPGGGRAAASASPDPRAFGRALGQVGQLREKAESLGGALFGGGGAAQSLPRLLSGLGPLAGAGAAGAFLAPIAAHVLQYLEERLNAAWDKRERAFLARQGEERFRADYNRRFAEDPQFARVESRQAFEDTLAEEALRGPRLEPYTADLTLGDYGL